MKIAIVGGGIGGMALALALHDAGLDDVEVFESAPAVKELGVGINVMPHAVRELAELGLLDDLTAVGIPTTEFVLYSKHGQRIWGEPRGLAAGYRWPQFAIHRGELLGVLHRAVLERLGPARVHTGHHLARFGQQDGKVWGEFVDRQRGAPPGGSRPTCSWAATASTRSCARRSTRTKDRPTGTASRCGGGSSRGSPT